MGSIDTINLNLMLVVTSLEKLELLESRVNDVVVSMFSEKFSQPELLEMHQEVHHMTDEMSTIHGKVSEILGTTDRLFSEIFQYNDIEVTDAIELVKSHGLYEDLLSDSTVKKHFIQEVQEINQQFHIECTLNSLESDYNHILTEPSQYKKLSSLYSLNHRIPSLNHQTPPGFRQRILDLHDLIEDNICSLSPSESELLEQFDIETLSNEIKDIELTLVECRNQPCEDPQGFMEVRQNLQELQSDLEEFHGIILSQKVSESRVAIDRIQDYTANLLDEIEALLRDNLKALQVCVKHSLQTVDTPNRGDCLFLSLEKQVEGTSHERFRQIAVKHLKNHKNEYKNTVFESMVNDLNLQNTYSNFLKSLGEEIMAKRFGYKEEDIQNADESFLTQLGLNELNDSLEKELGSPPDNFDRYCKWMSDSRQWGSDLEIDAISKELKRPVILFKGDGSVFEKLVNGQLPGSPLLLHHVSGKHFQPLISRPQKSKRNPPAS